MGNLARNYFRGPGYHTWDSSIFKTIPITERISTELRLQGYNLTNTPEFVNPQSNVNNGDFGKDQSTRLSSERRVEIAVRLIF
jgi:hypothetical protein